MPSLLKFDVSGLNGQTIASAKIRLYNVDAATVGGNFYRVADNTWQEGTVTWSNAPAADTNLLASLGSVSVNTWYEVDVTSLVTGDGTYSLRVSSTSTNGADYSSKEGANAPQLVITLAGIATPTQTPSATSTPSSTTTPTAASTPTQTLTDIPVLPTLTFTPVPAGPLTINYAYDPLNRLTNAIYSDGRSFAYTYDPAGNVLELGQNLGPGTVTTVYTYDAANQLNTAQQGSTIWQYTYDANGSLISDGVKTYSYDSANRLIMVDGPQSPLVGSSTVELSYNGLGQRLSMDAAGVIAHYVLDGDRPLTAESSGNTTYYLYGLGGVGEKTTAWNYSLPDGTNTPRQLSDLSGDITLSARYSPWGDTLDTFGTGGFTFGYLGGVLDAATGLLYVGNGQYYDPSTGRFLTRDVNPNSTNPYVPWNPIGAILGPLAVLSMFYSRKRKHGKWDTVLIIVLLGVSAGVGLVACAPPPVTPAPGAQPAAVPTNNSPTNPSPAQQPVSTEPGTVVSIVPSVTSSPTEIPELGCPVPVLSAQDEDLKLKIETQFGIILDDPREAGSEYWPSIQIQIIYSALSKINDVLGGNLKSLWLGGHSALFYKFKNILGDGIYYGKTHGAEKINFFIVNTFPHHLIYHEMGHLLNNAQGQRFTNSLNSTAVYTDYPNQTGERVMGGSPYDRIDGKGYLYVNDVPDPCASNVNGELHPRSLDADGNTANEEWGDLFANYVAGNFDTDTQIGLAKHNWVRDQLFGG